MFGPKKNEYVSRQHLSCCLKKKKLNVGDPCNGFRSFAVKKLYDFNFNEEAV